jgi:hypothetical protein
MSTGTSNLNGIGVSRFRYVHYYIKVYATGSYVSHRHSATVVDLTMCLSESSSHRSLRCCRIGS